MNNSADFLVELGTEELPPKALHNLAQAFLEGIVHGLAQQDATYSGSARYYATPRRLAVHLEGLERQTKDKILILEGPSVSVAFDASGAPTAATLGFAKKCGAALEVLDRSGDKLRYSKTIAGQPIEQVLPAVIAQALNALPIPKRMRWGAGSDAFVRPTQWLLLLLGETVVDCTLLGQQAGRCSYGHRFHAPGPIEITHPQNYLATLQKAFVMADFNARKTHIQQQVQALAEREQARALMPEALLEEVTALVEWPVPLVCSFEERFLHVPQEALIATMQDNQKYFCLLDSAGNLLPRFITVANLASKAPEQIIAGNEKVVRPRLSDAEFFFIQDQRTPLEEYNQQLAQVVFQASLGSVFDKAQRVSKLAAFIATELGSDAVWAARAGILSKCDLASALVGEFPEMQGIAGTYYAKLGGEAPEVACALQEQYMPRAAGAGLPKTRTGSILALADKLDTLVGIFGIGLLPTGSKDPYALRRAALGILRIVIEQQLPLSLSRALSVAAEQYGSALTSQNTEEIVYAFIFDRLRARYEEEGVDPHVYQAVRVLGLSCALDFDQRIQALQGFRTLPAATALAAANKRVSNLLSKAQGAVAAEIEAHYFDHPKEFSLYAALQQAQQAIAPLLANRQYAATLEVLARLREPVDAFFEQVLVNAEDPQVRSNRYALLAKLRALFLGVADISLLS